MTKAEKQKEIKQIADDLSKVSAISALGDTEGGKVLITSLIKDVIDNVETLCAKNKELTMQEFVSICSDMKNKLDLVKVFKNSKKNKDYLKELYEEAILKEEEE